MIAGNMHEYNSGSSALTSRHIMGFHHGESLEVLALKKLVLNERHELLWEKSDELPETSFEFCGLRFGVYGKHRNTSWDIELIGHVALIPFTVENMQKRADLMRIAALTQKNNDRCFRLDKDCSSLVFHGAIYSLKNLSIKSLLTEITLILIGVRPWLDFMHRENLLVA